MRGGDSRFARLNMGLAPDAKSDLVQVTSLAGQDLTSSVLDAASQKARTVALESAMIRVTGEQYDQLVATFG